jgi:hypothetical protein
MRSQIKAILILNAVPLLVAGALRGEGVAVTITNDGAEDIMVTLYDKSTNPQRLVLNNTRINGFTSAPISLVADPTGRANLSWTAISAESLSPKCGHADAVVSNAATVNVHVDSPCST